MKTASLGAAGLPLLAAQGLSQTSSRKYRVCEIGHDGDYGHMAGAFAESPNVTMAAVADPVEKAGLEHARSVKASRAYVDFREMLQKEKPDIVAIGPNRKTYSAQRLEMIQAAAELGAHVMADKPHARSLEEADQIIALAEKHKIKSVIYHPVRIAPAVVRLKKLVDEGLIGDIVEVQVWGVEQLLHMGWHPIYLLRYFAGEPVWCSARVTQGDREFTLEDARDDPTGRSAGDTAHASYAFAGRVQGHFVWQNNGGPYQMTLYGSKGVVHFMITDDPQIYHFPDPEWTPGKPGVDWRLVAAPKDVKTGSDANIQLLIADLFRAIETDTQTVASFYEASEKLNLGFIGVNGRGAQNMAEMAGENVAALCDVDERHLGQAAERFPKARQYRDFRKMIDEATDLDAVVISTPHHIHAHATARALKAGKHVYWEKPLTHTVWEARAVAELAAKHKVATQHGTNAHTFSDFQRAALLIQGGAIGPVREAHVWCDESYGGASRPKDRLPVPEYLDWDLWLGPSPERPYHKDYHPYGWHYFSDFGEGTVGNMGPHLQDLPFWALKLRYPLSVEAEGPPVDPESPPTWIVVRYEFGAREELPPVKLTWRHGGKHPNFPEGFNPKGWTQGILFVGEKGQLAVDYDKLQLLPQSKFADFTLGRSAVLRRVRAPRWHLPIAVD